MFVRFMHQVGNPSNQKEIRTGIFYRYLDSGSDNNGEHLLTRTERSFGGNKIEPPSRPNSYWDDPHYRPYFDNSTERNATAQLGKTAYLNCKIRQLGDRTVGAECTHKLNNFIPLLP
ncbi:uncharacterized protein TNIN_322681 [Trichonephila inaurata madagascariensis]|uniref:Uncharacterized protein n=1 Tax=Trichonephila inaurata madagascariensis TaxID=2747483 RepID=A0A8X6Y4W9_9ARAC|nr:uncharacterized protein TNIN_322681 [Trichonephila inaurata madagascariensis]